MRQLVATTLLNTQSIRNIVGNRIWSANQVGEPPLVSNPKTPFLVVQGMPNTVVRPVQQTARSAFWTFDIRAYDERGDYGIIDQLLILCRESLLGTVDAISPDRHRCTFVRWMGFGVDSDDPILDKIFKTCTMQFLSNI